MVVFFDWRMDLVLHVFERIRNGAWTIDFQDEALNIFWPWAQKISQITKQMVHAKMGNFNIEFWKKIVIDISVNKHLTDGMSYLTGWISTFSFFGENGE